jgi:ABC-type protease/lipase transport system fused ATPase/permease subunit
MDQLTPDAAAKLHAIHPLLGYAASALFIITTTVTLINNYRTKKNTEANNATAAMLESHKREMIALKDEAIKGIHDTVSEFSDSVNFAKNQILEEARAFKLGVMKLREESKQGLSMIPRLQDHLEKLDKRSLDTAVKASLTEEKVEEIMNIVRRAKGGK